MPNECATPDPKRYLPTRKWHLRDGLEIWDEMGGYGDTALPHYMFGRQPGKYPTFEQFRKNVHWVPDLYDPFGFNRKMSEEKKQTRLLAEIVSNSYTD